MEKNNTLFALLLSIFLIFGAPALADSTKPTLFGVAYGKNMFAAVGEKGTVLISKDGYIWVQAESGTSENLYGVTYCMHNFIAVGRNGTILTSQNGKAWYHVKKWTDATLRAITCNDSGNLAVAAGKNVVLRSKDLFRWTPQPLVGISINAVTFAQGRFYAVGGGKIIYVSDDGVRWNYVRLDHKGGRYNLLAVADTGGSILVGGENGLIARLTSGGLGDIQRGTVNQSRIEVASLVSSGQGCVAAIHMEGYPSNGQKAILASDNCKKWVVVPVGAGRSAFHAVTYGKGLYVVVGSLSEILVSPNGHMWQAPQKLVLTTSEANKKSQPLQTKNGQSKPVQGTNIIEIKQIRLSGHLSHPAIGDNKVVIPRIDGYIYTYDYYADKLGKSNISDAYPGINTELLAAAYGKGSYVIVGKNGYAFSSGDGYHWEMQNTGTEDYLHSVAFGNGTFVAAGVETLLVSSDAKRWGQVELPWVREIYSVSWANGKFFVLALSLDGLELYTSSDGSDWYRRLSLPYFDGNAKQVIYCNQQYIMLLDLTQNTYLWRSDSGITWDKSDMEKTQKHIAAVSCYEDTLFAVSDSLILKSSDAGRTWKVVSLVKQKLEDLVVNGDILAGIGEEFAAIMTLGKKKEESEGKRPTSGRATYPKSAAAESQPRAATSDGRAMNGKSRDYFKRCSARSFAQITNMRIQKVYSTGDDYAQGVAMGEGGNIYVTGYTYGQLGGARHGNSDGIVLKIHGGEIAWIKQFGSAGADWPHAVAVGADGTVAIVGTTEGTLPGQRSFGGKDAFLVLYGSNGSGPKYYQFGTSRNDYAYAVAIDGSGNIYVAGHTWGALNGQRNLGNEDAYVMKLNRSLSVVWTRQFGSSDGDFVGIGALRLIEDKVFLAGHTNGLISAARESHMKGGQGDAYIARIDAADGAIDWLHQYGTDGNDYAFSLAADHSGAYAAGYTTGTFSDFGNERQGGDDAYVIKYSLSGQLLWVRQFGTAMNDHIWDLALVGEEGVIAVGDSNGNLPHHVGAKDAMIQFLGARNGELHLAFAEGDNGIDIARGVVVDPSTCSIGIVGWFESEDQPSNDKDLFLFTFEVRGVVQ